MTHCECVCENQSSGLTQSAESRVRNLKIEKMKKNLKKIETKPGFEPGTSRL